MTEKQALRLDEQILNVIDGRTAFGETCSLPRLAIAPGSILVALSEDHIDTMLTLLSSRLSNVQTDAFRTALIWKMLDLYSKIGLRPRDCEMVSKLHSAMLWICNHPNAIFEPVGFAKIIELGDAMAKAAIAKRQSFAASQLEPLRLEANPPARSVIWEDLPFRLERLDHPFHLFEEGVRMKNCLADVPKIEVSPGEFAISALCLKESPCWWAITTDHSEYFSFRIGDHFAATFEIRNSEIIQFQLAFQNQPQLFPIMARALGSLGYSNRLLRVATVNKDSMALRSALEGAACN